MNLELNNKIAVITGSSKGLGFATASVLSAEGAKVVINGRDEKQLQKSYDCLPNKNNGIIARGDVTKNEDCHSIINQAIQSFGGLDILITNCGGPKPGSFEELTESDWDEAIRKSLLSHVYLIKHAIPYLKKSACPSILTITSFTAKQPLPNMVLSNSIRAAVIGLTKTLSIELGIYKIRVNSILPGWTHTDRVDNLLIHRSQANHSLLDEEMERITNQIPLKRMGRPEEFAQVAAFLVSPAASFINGVMLNVDGGIIQSLF